MVLDKRLNDQEILLRSAIVHRRCWLRLPLIKSSTSTFTVGESLSCPKPVVQLVDQPSATIKSSYS